MDALLFYQSLMPCQGSLSDVLRNPSAFQIVPETWTILLTDIQGSTQATAEGRARDINTIAASCVIACLNIAKKRGVEIAFFYGGDGATVLLPTPLHQELRQALDALRAHTLEMYGLMLRVGSLLVRDVYAAGKSLRLAKWSVAEGYDQAVLLGDGLNYADRTIKNREKTPSVIPPEEPRTVDLVGLRCRWNKITPEIPASEIVCLIVQAREPTEQSSHYLAVLEHLDRLYGNYLTRHPITVTHLKTSFQIADIERSEKLSRGTSRFFALIREWIKSFGHVAAFRWPWKLGAFNARRYLQELKAATDTLHLSGTLYTIVSGTEIQRQTLRAALDELEKTGGIIYGLATCPASVMTCYVQKYADRHIHFLDGVDGGYTKASKEFKGKLVASLT